MKDLISKNVLITTQGWFYAADGKTYRAVWGKLNAVHEAGKSLGFIPNRAHANWFIVISGMIIMGCQVMYVLPSDNKPFAGDVEDYQTGADSSTDGIKKYTRPTQILILE